MLSFVNDYSQGAHEQILRRLAETNLEPLPGYGADRYCQSAKEKIRLACKSPAADVFFLTGGTQANAVVIAALLDSFEGLSQRIPAISASMKPALLNGPGTKC